MLANLPLRQAMLRIQLQALKPFVKALRGSCLSPMIASAFLFLAIVVEQPTQPVQPWLGLLGAAVHASLPGALLSLSGFKGFAREP